MKPKRKLNRNNLFIREKPDLPRLQFIERATGQVVEIELVCGDGEKAVHKRKEEKP